MNKPDSSNDVSIAFQGEHGAHSEAAARQRFGSEVATIPCEEFPDIYEAVSKGKAKYGVVPIENSLVGSIHRNYDLLLEWELPVVGEINYLVSHSLLGRKGTTLDSINKVYSHPVALDQCREFFKQNKKIKPIIWNDTAGAVKMLAESSLMNAAAVAGKFAAELYGMQILAENLEDRPNNYTRFLIISSESEEFEGSGKTSVVYSLNEEAGALFKSLSVFALRDISLTKIESRPMRAAGWQYYFYVDFVDTTNSERGQKALDHLAEIAPFIKVLGTYPRDLSVPNQAH